MKSPTDILSHLRDQIVERAIAAPRQAGDDSWQAVAFLAGDQKLLVNMQQVTEVVEIPAITIIPGVQAWVAGIANVRGLILPLIDLGLYLESNPSQTKVRCHVITVERADTRFGLIVEQVVGMRQVSSEKIEDNKNQRGIEKYLSGEVEIAEETWQIFDTDKLMFSEKFHQVATA
jgi:twitching motility protein PilI|tara:strand:+ start:77059 stop:77583 length:525 start_codon:yes stop_codon:yes gene_type:complete